MLCLHQSILSILRIQAKSLRTMTSQAILGKVFMVPKALLL